MKLQSMLAGAAVLAMSAPALAQNAPTHTPPGTPPPPAAEPATPMPAPPNTTPPADPAMSSAPSTAPSNPPPSEKPTAPTKKCDTARKSGKTIDPGSCPPPTPK